PYFEEKVRHITELYVNPPEDEIVVSVDAKTGIQALDRTQPALPMAFGKTAKRTHDYVRNGTLDMYAAIDVRTGKVTTSLSKTHATADFLRLMKKIVADHDVKSKIHVILDKLRFICRRTLVNGSRSRRGELSSILRRPARHG